MSDVSVETVETVATRLAARNRSLTIWIEADTATTPRQGNAMCARTAALLRKEAGAIETIDNPDESETVSHDHTAVYTMVPPVPEADWWTLLETLAGGRTVQPNVIIHAGIVPEDLKRLIDIRITVPKNNGSRSIVRLRPDETPTSTPIREEEMAGFVGEPQTNEPA
jgi:hypothetical protein